uniref:Uncharacterized protein n=1 Tax=viral metagenome TaxID=1070528 RepID=A0A6C0LZN7_9ZZZZ
MIWNTITNPKTGRKVSIHGDKGKNILHKYLQQFNNTIQHGGSNKNVRKTGPKSFHIEHNVPLITNDGDLISEEDILMLKDLQKQKKQEKARIIKIKNAKIKRDREKEQEKVQKKELKKKKEIEKKKRDDAKKREEERKKLEEEEFRKNYPDKAIEIDRLKRQVRNREKVRKKTKKTKKNNSSGSSFLPSAGQLMTLAVLRKIANRR